MTQWIVKLGRSKDAASSRDGLVWIQNFMNQYDLSLIETITIEPGRSKKAVGVYGKCVFPTKDRPLYRISCMLPGPFPCSIHIRKPPLYMNEDGSFPPTPKGCRRGVLCIDRRTERRWYRIVGQTALEDMGQAIVWITAHEAFHYLRRTRQIPGRNNEIQADAFADKLLVDFCKQKQTAVAAPATRVIRQVTRRSKTATAATTRKVPVKPKPKPKTAVKPKAAAKTRPQAASPKKVRPKPEVAAVQPQQTVRPAGLLGKVLQGWMYLWTRPPVQAKATVTKAAGLKAKAEKPNSQKKTVKPQ